MGWQCQHCTYLNGPKSLKCTMCSNPRSLPQNAAISGTCLPNAEKGWACSRCTFINPASNNHCEMCENERTLKESGSADQDDRTQQEYDNTQLKVGCELINKSDPEERTHGEEQNEDGLDRTGHGISGKENISSGGNSTCRVADLEDNDMSVSNCDPSHGLGCATNGDLLADDNTHRSTQSHLENGDWTCSQCTCINRQGSVDCEVCEMTRDLDHLVVTSEKDTSETHLRGTLSDVYDRRNDIPLCRTDDKGEPGYTYLSEETEPKISGMQCLASKQSCGLSQKVNEWSPPSSSSPPGELESHSGYPNTVQSIGNRSTDVLRIVLLGRTGSGKSATGNNILNGNFFHSTASAQSVTRQCQRGQASRCGRHIAIIDTPGMFDTEMANEDITREVVRCVGMTAPGPHVFVLVVRIDRFTEEEQRTVRLFLNIFGDNMIHHLVILFTRKDDLINDNITIEQYIEGVPHELKTLLAVCENRCVAFDNRATSQDEREQDVTAFLRTVDTMLFVNGGGCYTNEMYQEAEMIMRTREQQLQVQHDKEVQLQKNVIREECERKCKQAEAKTNKTIGELQEKLQVLEQGRAADDTSDIAALKQDIDDFKRVRDMNKRGIDKERLERERAIDEETALIDFRDRACDEVDKEGSVIYNMLTNGLKLLGSVVLKLVIRRFLPF